ncbi:MAG: NTP transferase domain-containing protein [Clostridia bacterium]|nr:NTP transferase domain-containing protein [Clostridia bacterium]
MYTVDNAVIMAAGTSSRFAPLSHEMPKALITVKGEVLIERQIRQLRQAGINDIYIVTGYKAEMFSYLENKLGVRLIHNPDYLIRNNNSSIYAARNVIKNTYICSADNYFSENPFEKEVSESYYAAVYADGETKEWCMQYEPDGTIRSVQIGGENAWYMLGHVFWSEDFSTEFLKILLEDYEKPETADLLWESIYIKNIEKLKMKIRKYQNGVIFEFDTLDELREFDTSYISDTRSAIIGNIAKELQCSQSDITQLNAYKDETNAAAGFTFVCNGTKYKYSYSDGVLRKE